MTTEAEKEWKIIFEQPRIYIYGAAKTAEKLYKFISDTGNSQKIKGFIVTDSKSNVNVLCDLPVYDVYHFEDRDACVLVPHLGTYKVQIIKLLDKLNCKNVVCVGQLYGQTILEKKENHITEAKRTGWDLYEQKDIMEKQRDAGIREHILNILKVEYPDFGGLKPYQSLELIGLDGIRPTEYRVREYQLREILKKEDDILDIGCNSGFLDITIAPLVNSVTGIEYDNSLVKTAEIAADYLGISNCIFCNSEFENWHRKVSQVFNVIFSFAIHHWINISGREYVSVIDKLLKPGGYLCFESHVYGDDIKFAECYKNFLNLNYRVICDKRIADNELRERQYVMLKKNS